MSSVFAPAEACSMKEFAAQFPERGLWVTSNGKPSRKLFSWPGWERRLWSQHLFGAQILRSSTQASGVESWIALLRGFLASRGAQRENSAAPKTNDGSGQQSPQSFAPSSRPSYSLRMCQVSL